MAKLKGALEITKWKFKAEQRFEFSCTAEKLKSIESFCIAQKVHFYLLYMCCILTTWMNLQNIVITGNSPHKKTCKLLFEWKVTKYFIIDHNMTVRFTKKWKSSLPVISIINLVHYYFQFLIPYQIRTYIHNIDIIIFLFIG